MQKETPELKEAADIIIKRLIDSEDYTEKNLDYLKRRVAGERSVSCPSKIILRYVYLRLLEAQEIDQNERLETLLLKSRIRTSSGVAPIAIVTRAFGCPARCVYCPTEVQVPKSYNSNEPAIMRAIHNQYDPARQIRTRLTMLERGGHSVDKVEIIVLGGTFSALPKQYVTNYFRSIFHELNQGGEYGSLDELQRRNESAKYRCVGITIETRPDWINPAEIKRLRRLGVTRVELGVQHLDDDVQILTRRGHGLAEVKRATNLLREAGFKIAYHMMPNLPGSTPKRDVAMFKELFQDPALRPDQLKVYNCVVTADADLTNWYQEGKYEPYDLATLLTVLSGLKEHIPRYCRIIRLGRDIPAPNIVAGCKYSNIRQLVHDELRRLGKTCQCIRCREVREKPTAVDKVKYFVEEYEANNGREFFLSFESPDRTKLFAHLRLRLPRYFDDKSSSNSYQGQLLFPELSGAGMVREVHTYGQAVPIDAHQTGAAQHIGLGKKLLTAAETICRDNNLSKIAVISGIGVRGYYRKQGYQLADTYMLKNL